MKNQISGSIALDLSGLAEIIATAVSERLATDQAGVRPVSLSEARDALLSSLFREAGIEDLATAKGIVEDLAMRGYTFVHHSRTDEPAPELMTTPLADKDESWFTRTD